MKFQIYRTEDNNIFVGKDYSDINDIGEISHILVEIEIIKRDLIKLWEEIMEDD